MLSRRSRVPLVVCLLSAGLIARAAAQPQAAPAVDPLGPVRCYLAATQGTSNLTLEQGKQLCIGAIDESPARCFAQIADQGFADAQAMRMCASAASVSPAECAERLKTTTGLDDASIVGYCAALPWPLSPLVGQGAPACVVGARTRTRLPDADTVRLCSGSTSAAPVDCYAGGQTTTRLTDADLVELCLPVGLYPYPP
ncbi:MAG TPA: hypothetical protein VHT91_44700 [Kofleriaceae bacterium]|jgi:hypothetical protein|nr:hypothetical protein [Kofleriaceae bacterium]